MISNPFSKLRRGAAVALLATCAAGLLDSPLSAQVAPETIREIHEKAKPSLVIAEFTYDSPGQRIEVACLAVVVSEDGRVMVPLDFVDTSFPDQYLSRFQIIIPAEDDEPERELPATFAGRDERSGVAFIQYDPDGGDEATTQPATDEAENEDEDDAPPEWVPLSFVDERPEIGESVVSVGRLPEDFGYGSYVTASRISTPVRGPIPMLYTVGDGLTTIGSPVFNADGQAIGYVIEQQVVSPVSSFINTQQSSIQTLSIAPPRLFLPADFFRISLENPPTPNEPVAIPDLGIRQLEGLSKDLQEYYELGNTPAVQIGDVVADSAAEEAGINVGDVVVALNGEPLERGDTPEELPDILDRTISRMPVGETVTFTLLDPAGERREVEVTLRERPQQPSAAAREYFEDLGFSAREVVFDDLYFRKLSADTQGVLIDYIRQNSAAASAGLQGGDLIRKLNQTDVTGLEQFAEVLREFREQQPTEAVVMEVIRGGDTQVIRLEPPQ